MPVAIIPARGGSKGIVKKNITDFLGNPLITYTIKQAINSEEIDDVYVSTDAEDIAMISREAGAQVIERPDRLAGDKADTESALVHALQEIRDRGSNPETIVLLQCTSPLRREGDIDGAINLVSEEGFDSALSACKDHKFYWSFCGEKAEPINYNPQTRKRRQELESERYQENGSIYVFRADILEEKGCRLGGEIGVYEMPKIMSDEIDTPEDLQRVESIGEAISFNQKNHEFRWKGTGV